MHEHLMIMYHWSPGFTATMGYRPVDECSLKCSCLLAWQYYHWLCSSIATMYACAMTVSVSCTVSCACCLLCRYVLKSQMKELLELEAKNAISIEEEIEMERKKVDAKTPITEEVCSCCIYLLCAGLRESPSRSRLFRCREWLVFMLHTRRPETLCIQLFDS